MSATVHCLRKAEDVTREWRTAAKAYDAFHAENANEILAERPLTMLQLTKMHCELETIIERIAQHPISSIADAADVLAVALEAGAIDGDTPACRAAGNVLAFLLTVTNNLIGLSIQGR